MDCFSNSFKEFDFVKKMAAWGRGHLSIYGYFEIFLVFSISLPSLLQTESYSHQTSQSVHHHKGYLLTN